MRKNQANSPPTPQPIAPPPLLRLSGKRSKVTSHLFLLSVSSGAPSPSSAPPPTCPPLKVPGCSLSRSLPVAGFSLPLEARATPSPLTAALAPEFQTATPHDGDRACARTPSKRKKGGRGAGRRRAKLARARGRPVVASAASRSRPSPRPLFPIRRRRGESGASQDSPA